MCSHGVKMTVSEKNRPVPGVEIGNAAERRFIIFFCIVAMLRVFLLNAAFPLFNPVDELLHFDTIVKHAEGNMYRHRNADPRLDLWSAKMQLLYGSPEYLYPPEKITRPPFMEMNTPRFEAAVNSISERFANQNFNCEMNAPPLYYYTAGVWLNIGKMFHANEGLLLYWLRFLNVVVYGVIIWLAYLFCRDFSPGDSTLRIAVPMILSVFPNDSFYSLNSDVFSPLFCLLALYMLQKTYLHPKSVVYYAMTGLAISATVLVKLTNIPVFVLCACFAIILLYRRIVSKQHEYATHFAALGMCSLAPILLWMGWNYYAVGDITGTSEKIRLMQWSRKPFAEWLDHPLFSIDGLDAVAANMKLLTATFWRGELVVWHGSNNPPAVADWFYTITSVVFIGYGIASIWSKCKDGPAAQCVLRFSIPILLLMYVGFIMILSIQIDFGSCATPSRANPFFNKGRLVMGGLVPFLILYVDGVCHLMSKLKMKLNSLYIIGSICVLMVFFSTTAIFKVFGSAWNWYHILR